jgi:hypothetical protein
MGLEGALFTFQLSTFEKTNLNFKYLTCNLFLCTSTSINLEYVALNSLTTPAIQGQFQHMSVQRLINFEDSMPKKSNN